MIKYTEYVDSIANKLKTVLESSDNLDVKVILYTNKLEIIRGKYIVHILPVQVEPRVLTGRSDLAGITLDLPFYYVMDTTDDYQDKWVKMLQDTDKIIELVHNNLPDEISTVNVFVEFNNDITANSNRLINFTIKCEYKKYASR